jgi:hypothetical protein
MKQINYNEHLTSALVSMEDFKVEISVMEYIIIFASQTVLN